MMYRETDRKQPMNPQLALRVAIIGGVALVMLGVIFFRLWYLQVLSGDRYLAEANNNRVREITVQAPRGKIVDRNGKVLVDNRSGYAVKVNPARLPESEADKSRLYRRLARVLDMSPRKIRRDVEEQLKAVPFSSATVKPDVQRPVYQYVLEHQGKFPGVTVEQVFLRSYPQKNIASHLVGIVGEVNAEELKDRRNRGVEQGDRIGKQGVEYSYDRFLRGKNGANRVQVDAMGTLRGELALREPRPGRQLRLSVDYDVQRTGQQSLGSARGAFVAMDVKTGEVRALGSSPSFDPNLFSKAIKEADYKRLSNPLNGAPLTDRSIQGQYPTGSTFKLITATAGLQGGLITPGTVAIDNGSLKVGGVTFRNAGNAVHGPVALRKALQVSSDVFFYRLGLEMNGAGDGHLLQKWASRYGIGRRSGIDLPSELPGRVPSPEWRNRLFKKKLTDRPWSSGDNINLSVGQGDIAASPLQMAVAYAAIANGGRVVRPHLGNRVEDSEGRAIQEFSAPARRKLDIAPANRQAILEGLRQAAGSPGGTSYDVFKNFPIKIAGKTGTAEKGAGRADQSWYAALAPYPNPRYVVVTTFESGGFGAETAAPAAKKILAALFDVRDRKATMTTSNVRPLE